MAYAPIAFTAPNYRDNANEWIKAYEPGTTTPKVMALESNGGTQVAKLQLNADGFIVSAGAALVIPHLSGSYDLWLFPTEAEADANDTSDAIRLADNISSNQINDLSQAYDFPTVAAYKASTILFPVGKRIYLADRDAYFNVITGNTATLDEDVIYSSSVNQSITISETNELKASQLGALDAVDSTSAIQRGMTISDDFTIDTSSVITTLAFRSSATVTIDAELSSASVTPFNLTTCFGTEVNFTGKGKLSGDALTATQNGIVFTDCINVKVNNPFVEGCLNKGIDIVGTSIDNVINKPRVRGSTGVSGAGVSIFGALAIRNVIDQPDCSGNRIGVTINGADYNTVNSPICNGCTSSGVSIDGIINDSGDGGRYNTINSPTCNSGTDATKGGVFIGNGSSYNKVNHPVCLANAGAGIRFSGGVGFENKSNSIVDPVCNNNSANGMTLSFCPSMTIKNPTCQDNTGRGIADLDCDGLKVIGGGLIDGNTTDGILHQSPRTLDDGVTVTNNGADGIEIAFGGALGLGDNRTINCHTDTNTGLGYKAAGGSKAENLTGFVTNNKGQDTKSDGQTIAHGLASTPAFINATGSVAGEIITVTARSTTTFTVAVKGNDGTAGTSQAIDWSASLY